MLAISDRLDHNRRRMRAYRSLVLRGLIVAALLHLAITAALFGMPFSAVGAVGGAAVLVGWRRWSGRGRRVVLALAAISPLFVMEVGLPELAVVSWANFHMAMGGYVAHFPEVAWETLALDFESTDETECARQSMPGAYANPDTNWRTALALMVPGGTLEVRRVDEEHAAVTWRGSIQYPISSRVRVPAWRIFGGAYHLTFDEGLFCAMQMDGAFVPYQMAWRWTLAVDDARLKPDRRGTTDRGLVDRLLVVLH